MLPLTARRRPAMMTITLGLTISIGAGWLLIQLVDLAAVWVVLSNVRLPIVAAGVISLGLSMVIRTARWRAILPESSTRPTVTALFPFVIVGYAVNAIAPLRAGDAARGVITARRFRLGVPETLGSVGLERLLDGLALAALVLIASIGIAVPVWFTQTSVVVVAVAVAILLGVLLFGALARRVAVREHGLGKRFWRGVRSNNAHIGQSLAWSLAAWCVDGVTFWLCALALGIEVTVLVALLIAGGAALGSVTPSAPAAAGTFELAGTAVAISVGVSPANAFALVVLAHVVTVVPIVVAGLVIAALAGLSLPDLYRMRRMTDDTHGVTVSARSAS